MKILANAEGAGHPGMGFRLKIYIFRIGKGREREREREKAEFCAIKTSTLGRIKCMKARRKEEQRGRGRCDGETGCRVGKIQFKDSIYPIHQITLNLPWIFLINWRINWKHHQFQLTNWCCILFSGTRWRFKSTFSQSGSTGIAKGGGGRNCAREMDGSERQYDSTAAFCGEISRWSLRYLAGK